MHHPRASRVSAARSLLLFVALVAAPAAIHAQETQDTMRLRAPLRTARAAMTAAYGALDARRAAGFFTDSAVVEFQGQVITGRPAVDGWLSESLQGIGGIRFGSASFTVSESQ